MTGGLTNDDWVLKTTLIRFLNGSWGPGPNLELPVSKKYSHLSLYNPNPVTSWEHPVMSKGRTNLGCGSKCKPPRRSTQLVLAPHTPARRSARLETAAPPHARFCAVSLHVTFLGGDRDSLEISCFAVCCFWSFVQRAHMRTRHPESRTSRCAREPRRRTTRSVQFP